MQREKSRISAVPTNVITGFLGVGKTSAILHLLQKKPQNERWAVLVNEFGEVGIDGSLFAGVKAEEQGAYIREVPGGCMCCAAGLPMQIALNMLLTRANPDRLLIEPTGLGHPREILDALAENHYHDVLDVRATVTLVDARKVQDSRYTDNATFTQQLAVADVIVANKSDQYQEHHYPALLDYIRDTLKLSDTPVFQVCQAALQLEWLQPPASRTPVNHHHHHDTPPPQTLDSIQVPEQGYVCVKNEGEGFHSCGWVFDSSWIFDAEKLRSLFMGVNVERMKGVMITDDGVTAYNKTDNVLTETQLDDSLDSRVECIGADVDSLGGLQAALLDCVAVRKRPYP